MRCDGFLTGYRLGTRGDIWTAHSRFHATEEPGSNVKAKTGQGVKGNPVYTSQTRSRCGHVGKANRPSQAVFARQACNWALHADHNAAINILARAGLPSVPRSGPRDADCCTGRSAPAGDPYDP